VLKQQHHPLAESIAYCLQPRTELRHIDKFDAFEEFGAPVLDRRLNLALAPMTRTWRIRHDPFENAIGQQGGIEVQRRIEDQADGLLVSLQNFASSKTIDHRTKVVQDLAQIGFGGGQAELRPEEVGQAVARLPKTGIGCQITEQRDAFAIFDVPGYFLASKTYPGTPQQAQPKGGRQLKHGFLFVMWTAAAAATAADRKAA